MKAHLRSVRIAPKKANIIAKMVRGMPVHGAMEALRRTHKKGARMVEQLLRSAMANASHNDQQTASQLVIKTIVVNQATGYRRGVPMSRGRVRPMTKFLSHISLTLGIADTTDQPTVSVTQKQKKGVPAVAEGKVAKKAASVSSQTKKNTVKVPAHTKNSPLPSDASAKEDASSAS